jgi:DNA-binding MarR family transcriptional regulator
MKNGDIYWKLYPLISGVHLKIRRLSEQSLKPLNITWPQFEVLSLLSFGDNMPQTELAARLDKDTTTVMVICDSLENRRLLNRVKDPADRRINRIVLTEKGKSIIAKAYQLITANYKIITAGISHELLEEILPALEQLNEIIKKNSERNEVAEKYGIWSTISGRLLREKRENLRTR